MESHFKIKNTQLCRHRKHPFRITHKTISKINPTVLVKHIKTRNHHSHPQNLPKSLTSLEKSTKTNGVYVDAKMEGKSPRDY